MTVNWHPELILKSPETEECSEVGGDSDQRVVQLLVQTLFGECPPFPKKGFLRCRAEDDCQ